MKGRQDKSEGRGVDREVMVRIIDGAEGGKSEDR